MHLYLVQNGLKSGLQTLLGRWPSRLGCALSLEHCHRDGNTEEQGGIDKSRPCDFFLGSNGGDHDGQDGSHCHNRPAKQHLLAVEDFEFSEAQLALVAQRIPVESRQDE